MEYEVTWGSVRTMRRVGRTFVVGFHGTEKGLSMFYTGKQDWTQDQDE